MTDDQGRRSGFYDLYRNGAEFVDAQDAVYLGEGPLQEAEVPPGESRDGGGDTRTCEVVGLDLLVEAPPVAGEDELELLI